MKSRLLYCFLFHCCLMAIAQEQTRKGFPSVSGNIDIKEHFVNPPKGYGNVPFYWWNGDSLKKERLLEQLNTLSDASIDGFSISYVHTHPKVDVEVNANGYGSYGKVDPGAPKLFTTDWWNTWNWFSKKCAEKGIGLGLDDYVIGWVKNGYYVDELLADDAFSTYQGRLKIQKYIVIPHDVLNTVLPEHTISIVAYPAKVNLQDCVKGDTLTWKSTMSDKQTVYIIYSEASHELHPEYGKKMVDVYFNRFEKKLDAEGRKGMNYFFQDELHYNLDICSWCEDMPIEFKKQKGYDVQDYLPALFDDIGSITPKIRLDYAEVVTKLAEERYFKPVFDWHQQRGLIYGCDNNGRGLRPLQYLDYFRAISWFTAPGNDAPARGSSFRQTKVSSSVAHLYQRPRTWLEAFHSMGWDSNGEWLTSQLDHHLIAGGNLLCMHGLYYSTHGGWWEWAPPCFHFRMPYWAHMKQWLKYAERLSFVLSQGSHVCDIALMYPTETLQAYPESNMNVMWNLADLLSSQGLDYDFIDFQSLQKAKIKEGELSVSNEKYKVLILAGMKALHHETLLKIIEFHKKGGIVIAVGCLPEATSKVGLNDKETNRIISRLFTQNKKGLFEMDYRKVPDIIYQNITPDFKTNDNKGKVLHRRIGKRNVYMIMDVDNGTNMFFRTTGKVECWDAKDGSMREISVLGQTKEGTWIRYDGEANKSCLFVFSPGIPKYDNRNSDSLKTDSIIPITGNWQTEIVPTMNNKWGDFRLPATNELIGVEARDFCYSFIPDTARMIAPPIFPSNALKGVYGYAPYMQTLTLDASINLDSLLQSRMETLIWQPYCYSWQYGVFDNPGSQGYHGLKGKVDDRFIILDKGGHQLFKTLMYVEKPNNYHIEQEGVSPDFLLIDGVITTSDKCFLSKGWHNLLLAYARTAKGKYNLPDKKANSVDNRNRSAVVFYEEGMLCNKQLSAYDSIIAMKWYDTEHLSYNIMGNQTGIWAYKFETAPGTQSLSFKVKGIIKQLWIDNEEYNIQELNYSPQNTSLVVYLKKYNKGISTVVLTASPLKGFSGPAFFAEPVRITCKEGEMSVGNWSKCGALKYYSGGILYKKNLEIPVSFMSKKITLDLGKVNATCEVKVNGTKVDVLMNPPYRLDVSRFVKSGNNQIEVLVYSTLSNHYQTIPSAYRGEPCSGLLGPVRIIGCK